MGQQPRPAWCAPQEELPSTGRRSLLSHFLCAFGVFDPGPTRARSTPVLPLHAALLHLQESGLHGLFTAAPAMDKAAFGFGVVNHEVNSTPLQGLHLGVGVTVRYSAVLFVPGPGPNRRRPIPTHFDPTSFSLTNGSSRGALVCLGNT